MILSNAVQFNHIVFSLMSGVITGVLFDIYRALIGVRAKNKFIIVIEDLMFWSFLGIVIFSFLFYNDGAVFTAYSYMCIILGIYIYFKLLSKKIFVQELRLFSFALKVIRILYNTIIYPFRIIINYLINK